MQQYSRIFHKTPQPNRMSKSSLSLLIFTFASRMYLPPSTLTFSILGVLSTTLVSRFCEDHITPGNIRISLVRKWVYIFGEIKKIR